MSKTKEISERDVWIYNVAKNTNRSLRDIGESFAYPLSPQRVHYIIKRVEKLTKEAALEEH